MNLIALTEKLIAERGYGDEMLASLMAMIDGDIEELKRRKEELATEFATRRASLTALIGEEGAAS